MYAWMRCNDTERKSSIAKYSIQSGFQHIAQCEKNKIIPSNNSTILYTILYVCFEQMNKNTFKNSHV